jgi:recombining binding protein (suppressor of hairless)
VKSADISKLLLIGDSSAKFQYTFFDAFGQNNNIPEVPITPFPTLFSAPNYRPANNTLELTVSNFFYTDSVTREHIPLDVYLGNLGPLRHRVYQTSQSGAPAPISPFVQTLSGPQSADDPSGMSPAGPPVPGPPQYLPSGPMHTIVIVEIPPMPDVLKALEEDALPPNNDDTGNGQPTQPGTEDSVSGSQQHHGNGSAVPPPSIAGRSLPLLFIRASDGVGYHSGRTIACENVFQALDLSLGPSSGSPSSEHIETGWLTAAQAAASVDTALHGWTLRVM